MGCMKSQVLAWPCLIRLAWPSWSILERSSFRRRRQSHWAKCQPHLRKVQQIVGRVNQGNGAGCFQAQHPRSRKYFRHHWKITPLSKLLKSFKYIKISILRRQTLNSAIFWNLKQSTFFSGLLIWSISIRRVYILSNTVLYMCVRVCCYLLTVFYLATLKTFISVVTVKSSFSFASFLNLRVNDLQVEDQVHINIQHVRLLQE